MVFLRALKWILGSLLVILAGLAVVLHKLSGSETLGKGAVAAIEAAHKSKIDELNKQIAELSQDQAANQDAINKAQLDVDSRKQDLALVYKQTGMSEDEILDRLSKLKV